MPRTDHSSEGDWQNWRPTVDPEAAPHSYSKTAELPGDEKRARARAIHNLRSASLGKSAAGFAAKFGAAGDPVLWAECYKNRHSMVDDGRTVADLSSRLQSIQQLLQIVLLNAVEREGERTSSDTLSGQLPDQASGGR